ncbi:amidohydrolase [Ekhidna lutea]|uniref:Amidohydrolase n=1 Tax=Ekhidna lutea TaxID=447679 RepID=A0A239GMF3_EKHLU|nr:amidohydrolase [Ekhidna lutea]SNS69948.1 amidohydrolase [Ekhidna lutea]
MEEGTIKDLIDFRLDLHKHPEVSQKEFETQKRIINYLDSKGIKALKAGGTGAMVIMDSGKAGKTIMLRSDHDALPIQEINDFDHKSSVDGVSHKCGHDGHTAIMCGVAQYFQSNPIKKGKLVLVFQPAEENGEGAKAILADDNFNFEPDLVFALHNLPGYPLHQIVIKDKNFTTAAKSIIIKLSGKTSHAAEPELGINPARAIAELINMFEAESQPDLTRDDFALGSPVHINMGEKSYGITAGYGEVHYTLRTWNGKMMKDFAERVVRQTEETAKNHQLKLDISWTEEFDSNNNHPDSMKEIRAAIEVNGFDSTERERPFKWGEDFGLFTQKYPGAMFGIGSGDDCPALHNPDYDFPDEIIPTGIKMFTTIVEKAINE